MVGGGVGGPMMVFEESVPRAKQLVDGGTSNDGGKFTVMT